MLISEMPQDFTSTCPIPISRYPNVTLAHGSGGKLMHQLIGQMVLPTFDNPLLAAQHDGAILNIGVNRLAFTTDSYVVSPLFFPGGNIGKLAVTGTVNDLAMCGATPLYLSAGFIIEEGLPMETLWQIIQTMQATAAEANVQIVTGDTKVVDKGKGDGIFINTAGVGLITTQYPISPMSIRPGDSIILSADIGRHGIAIMAAREGLQFESEIQSDCALLNGIVADLLREDVEIHCMRDLTRGGLATSLVEIAKTAHLQINIQETVIPIRQDVQGACEILGLDPLYVANEGCFIAIVDPVYTEIALATMRSHPLGGDARVIGTVGAEPSGDVIMTTQIGTKRMIDMLTGEQLPRIC